MLTIIVIETFHFSIIFFLFFKAFVKREKDEILISLNFKRKLGR